MNFARVTCPKQNWDMESNAGGSAKPQASNFLTQQQEVEAAVNEDERYLRSLCSAVKGSEWHGKRLLSGQMVVQPICIYENLMSSKSWNMFVELSGVPIYHSIVSSTWGSWCFQLCLLLLSHELRGTLCNSTTGTAQRSHPFFRCKLHRWRELFGVPVEDTNLLRLHLLHGSLASWLGKSDKLVRPAGKLNIPTPSQSTHGPVIWSQYVYHIMYTMSLTTKWPKHTITFEGIGIYGLHPTSR